MGLLGQTMSQSLIRFIAGNGVVRPNNVTAFNKIHNNVTAFNKIHNNVTAFNKIHNRQWEC